ncbi:hypothetical protein EI94DRAFT_1713468 [Lactarius quietus]|nr:hypothetical protein EI94DRAFT_1713468 [Lactarius quietus]
MERGTLETYSIHELRKYCPVMFLISVRAVTFLKALYVFERKCLFVRVKAVNPEFMASCILTSIQIGTMLCSLSNAVLR